MDSSILNKNLNNKISLKDFFRAFGYTDNDTVYCRMFKDRDKGDDHGENCEAELWRFEGLEKYLHTMNEQEGQNRGVYFVVCGGGQTNAAAKAKGKVHAQFMECDDYSFEEQIRRLNGFEFEPSVIIRTRKSLHCYWLMEAGASMDRFRYVQTQLAEYFGGDTSIKNESRVMRLPGFLHQKAEPVMVRLIKFDPDLKYTQERLSAALPEVQVKRSGSASKVVQAGEKIQLPARPELQYIERDKMIRWLQEWTDEHDVGITETIYKEDGTVIFGVECPWKDAHTTEGGAAAITIRANGLIGYACVHAHCADKGWKDFRTYYEPEYNNPRADEIAKEIRERSKKEVSVATVKNGKTVPIKKVPEVKLISAKELYGTKLPEIYYPIEGLIPEGETILAAPPKSAKSWMALDMALSVAEGKPFLGFDTNKSDVVYFSLEDGGKFEQERLYKYCGNENEVPEDFHLIFEDWVTLDEGFIDQLEQVREKLPDLRFVIIDTLSKIQSRQRKNESAYERDYRTGQMIKKWADQYGIAVVVITHTTKLVRPDDALANVSGTNGVTGVADAVLVIAKEKRTDTEAVLAIDGRRVRQAEHEIQIDWDSCRWQYIGPADPDERERRRREREIEEVKSSTAYKAILTVADKNPDGWEGGARKLVNDAIGYGVLVTEPPKEVGRMLTNNVPLLALDGVRVQVIKNGTGANSYKLSAWHPPQEEGTEAPFDPDLGVAEYMQE